MLKIHSSWQIIVLLIQDNETLNRILSNRPLLMSEPLGWQGLDLEYCYSSAGSTHTLMVHMLQRYTTRSEALKVYSDGLSRIKLRLVIDYIQDNLEQDLGLKELAGLLQLARILTQ